MKFVRPTLEEQLFIADVNRRLARSATVHGFSMPLPDGGTEYRLTASAGAMRRTFCASAPFYHESPAEIVKLVQQWAGGSGRDVYTTEEPYGEEEAFETA